MSFFNINFFNVGNIFQLLDSVPPTSIYSNIKLFGGGIFDTLHGESYIYDQAKIDSLDFYSNPEWTTPTFLLMLFDNNLQGGNIISLPAPITNWLLLRKAQSEAKFTQLANLDADVDTYVDYTARSLEDYTYQWIPVADDLIGNVLQSDFINTNFTTVNLIDPILGDVYSMCLDLKMSEIRTEEDYVVATTKGKFDTVLRGNRKTKVGTISVLATSTSNTEILEQDRVFLDRMESFILSDKVKILKFPKGFSYMVQTNNWAISKKDGTQNNNTLYTVSFEWREVEDFNG